MDSFGDMSERSTNEENCEPPVYAISGVYSQGPESYDSEMTDSTCASTYKFVHSTSQLERFNVERHQISMEDRYNERECGICNFRPTCLQRCANIKVFVFLSCVLVTLQQTLSSGYLNSVITTIEKRFDIPSGLSGGIASTYEIGNLVTIIFVSYLGSSRHIPVWLGRGVVLMGLGSLTFVVPHLIAQNYSDEDNVMKNVTEQNICRPTTTTTIDNQPGNFLGQAASDLHRSSSCIKGSDSNGLPVFIFMIAQLLIGCGASPLFTLGTTYIDDHVKKDSASMYIGCMYSMVAFGPVCGFLLGGFLLSFHVDSLINGGTVDSDMTPVHPRWVGAWWGGFLIIGTQLLLISIPFFAFPKSLKWEKRKVLLNDYMKNNERNLPKMGSVDAFHSASSHKNGTYGKRIKDIPKSIMKLLCNPVYVTTCLGSCMELMIVSGFVVFLPKYLETQYSIGKSQANIFTGGIAIPGACVGVFMGGFLLKKFQLTPKGAIQFVIVFNATCLALYILVFFLGCDNVKMAGTTIPYYGSLGQPEDFQVNLTAVCNMECECSPNDILPICGSDGMTYFSPCHAGCTSLTPTRGHMQNYFNCACIMSNSTEDSFQEVTVVPVATSGPCSQICHTIIPFMVLLFIMSLAVSITQMPLLMIVLRSVSQEERSFALGMQFVIFRLFGYIPSPILFGNVIDSTCLWWKAHCSERSGFCLIYDIEQFRFRFVGICAGIKVLASALFWFDWYLIRHRYSKEDGLTIFNVGEMVQPVASINTSEAIFPKPVSSDNALLDHENTRLSYESSI